MLNPKFLNAKEINERSIQELRKINPDNLAKYNLPFLDQHLIAIAPAELVVVGSDTGGGKTFMANHLATTNAAQGRKVYLFSLEGHRYEAINRFRYQLICQEYYKDPKGLPMSYAKYEMNMIPGIEEYEEKVKPVIENMEKNLFMFDRSVDLSLPVLTSELSKLNDCDLIIIDHLHYFNLFDDKSEAQNLTEIVRTIKTLTEEWNIPIVLISHLRKKDKNRGLPDNEDFHGSSNIPKIASTCIILTSDPEHHDLAEYRYSTIFRVTKSRSGSSTTLGARLMFDAKYNQYENGYKLGKIVSGAFNELEYEDCPRWARGKED